MNQELDKISKFFSPENVVSNEDMKQALEAIATILKSFTEATSQINKETKQKLDLIVSQVNEEHAKIISDVVSKTSTTEQNVLKELKQAIDEVNTLKAQVSSLELQNGVDGQDADEEVIVEKVLNRIPKADKSEPETTESIASKLNKGKGILEASAIKGMKELVKHVASLPTERGGDSSNPISILSSSSLIKSGASKINFTGATVTQSGDTTNVSIAGSGQSSIQPQDEGVNLGASGTVDTINFVGAGVTATRATNTVTVTIPGGGAGSVPTGTGFRAVVAGVENAAAKLVDTADINNSQVTLAKMADVATGTVFYRKTAATGVPEVQTLATLKTDLGLTGTNSGDQTISLTGEVTGSGTGSFATTLLNSAVVGKVLTGLSLATSQVIAATDTVVLAFGYLQAQVTALTTTVAGKVASVTAGTNVTVTGTATAPIVNAPTMTATVGGAVPTPPNIATQFLNGQGIFSTPAGSGDMVLASAQTNSGLKTFLDTTFGLRNVANTFTGLFTNTITAARTWTLKDASGTLAFTSDITGTNSGTNTGDQLITLTGHVTGSGTGSFATSTASKMILQGTTDATTSAAQFLGALGTGIVKNTTTTGVLSIAINSDLPAMSATVGGAVPTPPNNTTTFLRGDGTFATPAGSGDMVLATAQTNSGVKTFLDTTMALRNVANTFSGVFTNAITAARTWTLKDASGTIAFTSDITGTNSGTNTGDQTITLTGGVTGSGTGSFAATVVTNANLTGDVTSVGNATTLTNAPVIAKVLTGYVSGAGTVAATDSILAAIQKLNGNDATNANLTGPITSVGNATSVAAQTGTGSTFVMNTSPTLVTPLLGTPTSGVMTNVTGIAAGLTSGITNALKSATTTIDVSAATAPTTGQVLTATAGTTATWQTPSGGSGFTYTEVTGTTQTAAVSTIYVTNNAGLVTVTLPSTATVGQIVGIRGSGAGGWRLAQNASQAVVWDAGGVAGTNITTAGVTGSISSSDRYDACDFLCITTNTGWSALPIKGNLSIV